MQSLVLLFIPGTLCTGAVFEHQISFLNSQFTNLTVETLDLSQVTDLASATAAAKAQIGDRSVILAGFSMGGFVALDVLRHYVRHFEPQCLGLVMLSSNCHADLAGRKAVRETHHQFARENGIGAMFDQFYAPNYVDDAHVALLPQIKAMAETLGLSVYERQHVILSDRPDSTATLQSATVPVLICAGENDKLCPESQQLYLQQHAQNPELVLLEQCGHFALLEQPDAVNQAMAQWLSSHFAAQLQ